MQGCVTTQTDTVSPRNLTCDLKHGIKVAHLNVRTLLSNIDEIRLLLSSHNIHILCVNETRLDTSISDQEIHVDGFSVLRKDRNRSGGGVAVFVSNSISYSVKDNLSVDQLEMVWLEAKPTHSKSFLICSVYRPPSFNKLQFFNYLYDNIELALSLGLPVMVMGDLNIDCVPEVYNSSNEIFKLCKLFNFKQSVTCSTRVTANTSTLIDVILSNFGKRLKYTSVLPITLSDHYMVYAVIGGKPSSQPNTIPCRSYKKFNLDQFLHDVQSELDTLCSDSVDDLRRAWERFKLMFLKVSNHHAPLRTFKIKGRAVPWINVEIVDLMKKRDNIHKRAVALHSSSLFNEYRQIRNGSILSVRPSYFR